MSNSQFPQRPSVKGSYDASPSSRRGSFGPREAGSTLAYTAAIQPGLLAAAAMIEQAAEPYMGQSAAIGVAGASWLSGAVVSILLKILAGFIRNYGAGLLHDLGAWLWSHALSAMWDTFADMVFPWRWNRRRRPDSWVPSPNNPSPSKPYRPFRDWWRSRPRRRERRDR